MSKSFVALEAKGNDMQNESFLAMARLVLIMLGTCIYFVMIDRTQINLWNILIFIAGFYYSLHMLFQTYVMGQEIPPWISALVDSLILWVFVWPIGKGEQVYLSIYYLNAIFISIRYERKSILWGFIYNFLLIIIGAYFFAEPFNVKLLTATLSLTVAISVLSAIIVAWTRKSDAKLHALYEISSIMNSSLQLDEVLQETILLVKRVVEFQRCHILSRHETDKLMLIASSQVFNIERILLDAMVKQTLFEEKNPYIVEAVNSCEPLKGYIKKFPCFSLVLLPIVVKEKVVGVLHVDTGHRHRFTSDEISLLSLVANQAGIAIENARLYKEMEEMAKRDGLTGIYNHRYFQETLQAELERAKHLGNTLSLAMIDVDNFKQFNDRFGHPTGDQVLIELAKLLRENMRSSDFVARYGGEEFTIIMPDTSIDQATCVVERIRKALETKVLIDKAKITVSIGVANFPDNASQKQELIDNADKALYLAKAHGRNRVELAC